MCSPVGEVLEVPPAPLQHILRLHAAAAELLLLHPVLHTAPAGEKIFAVCAKISTPRYLGVPMSSTVTGSSSPVTSSPANCWKSLTNQR